MPQNQQYTDEAIILEGRDWGQADKMLRLYTRRHGLVKAAAFGCRRARSPLAGGMQLFHEMTVTLAAGNNKDGIATVRQYATLDRHQAVIADIERLAYGSLIAESVIALSPEGVPDEQIYTAVCGAYKALGSRHPRLVALAAIVQLIKLSGWGEIAVPDGENAAAVRQLLAVLAALDWQNPPSFTARANAIAAAEKLALARLKEETRCRLKSLEFINNLRGAM